MNFLENMFAFGLSFYANDWIANQALETAFFTVGAIIMGPTLTTVSAARGLARSSGGIICWTRSKP